MLCALQFNVDSERQIFEELFHGNFILLSDFLPICWEEFAEEIFFILWQADTEINFSRKARFHFGSYANK